MGARFGLAVVAGMLAIALPSTATAATCNELPTDASGAVVVQSGMAPLPAPVAGQPLFAPAAGHHIQYGFAENAENPPALLPALDVVKVHQQMGATLIRRGINWGRVQPASTASLCFEFWDASYRTYVNNGIRPVYNLHGTPEWATTNPASCDPGSDGRFCQALPRPDAYDAWRAFAAAVARRYPLAAAIEIWNEPNHRVYSGGHPDPQRYAEVLSAAHDGIDQERPDMRVLAFSLSPERFTTRDANGDPLFYQDGQFITDALALGPPGVAQKIDGVSFHPYPCAGVPNPCAPTERSAFIATFGRIRDALVGAGLSDMRLVPDEMGRQAMYGNIVETANQSTAMLGRYRDLDLRRSDVPMAANVDAVIFYTGIDPGPGNAAPHMGWVTEKGLLGYIPKQVYCDFRRDIAGKGSSCPAIN